MKYINQLLELITLCSWSSMRGLIVNDWKRTKNLLSTHSRQAVLRQALVLSLFVYSLSLFFFSRLVYQQADKDPLFSTFHFLMRRLSYPMFNRIFFKLHERKKNVLVMPFKWAFFFSRSYFGASVEQIGMNEIQFPSQRICNFTLKQWTETNYFEKVKKKTEQPKIQWNLSLQADTEWKWNYEF